MSYVTAANCEAYCCLLLLLFFVVVAVGGGVGGGGCLLVLLYFSSVDQFGKTGQLCAFRFTDPVQCYTSLCLVWRYNAC